MKASDIEKALRDELHRIAPDIEIDDIDIGADLREELDINSMDFLMLVTALGKRLKLEMPEADYPKMMTFSDLLDYLRKRAG